MSVHPGLTRQLSTSSSSRPGSHSRQNSLMSPSRRSRFSINDNTAEVLEAKAHPGGLLRGIAARRAFNDIIWPMQAHARQYLARRHFVAMQAALYPQRSQTLEARVVQHATELRSEEEQVEALRVRVQDVETRVATAQQRYEDKAELVDTLERKLDDVRAAAMQDVSPDTINELQRRLDDTQRLTAERDSQIDGLLAKLGDVERQNHAATTSAAAVSRALEEARDRMEQRLNPALVVVAPAQPGPGEASTSRQWAMASSATLHKLDRTTRSPHAPPEKARVTLTLQIPGSETRDEVSPLASSTFVKRSASLRAPRTPIDSAMLSARSNRFSMPPQSAATTPIKVTIVRKRESISLPPQKHKEDMQKRLEAYYKPVFSPTTPGYGLRAVQETEAEAEEAGETLPDYAEQLLARLSQSDLTLGNGQGGDFSLRVGSSGIMETLEHAKQKQLKQARRESRPGLFKIFGLR